MVKLKLKLSLADEWNKDMLEQWEKHTKEVEQLMKQKDIKFYIKWNDEGNYFFVSPKRQKEGYNKREVKRLFEKWKRKYPALFV